MDCLSIEEKDRKNAQFYIEGKGQFEALPTASFNNGSTREGTRYSAYSRTNSNYQPGVCGLQNLGNTCFMNSALQCLSHVPELTEYFLSGTYLAEVNEQNHLGTQGKLVKAYAELLQRMWSGNNNAVRPWKLKCVIGEFAPHFNGYAQQDSQELMTFLLDGLHEDLNRIKKKKPYIEEKEADERNEAIVSREAWGDYKKRNHSIIVDLMHGQLKSTLVCNICHKVRFKFDPFCFLSIPIPANEHEISTAKIKSATSGQLMGGEKQAEAENGDVKNLHCVENGLPTTGLKAMAVDGNLRSSKPTLTASKLNLLEYTYGLFPWLLLILNYINPLKILSEMVHNFFTVSLHLEDCLKYFFSIDHLCGDDMCSCEHCKELRNGTKQSSITRLPQILIIHLKRFRHEGAYNVKLRTRINFPLYDLDMAPFMHPDSLPDAQGRTVPTKYDLSGVISHRGQNMEYGHYVAYCRNALDQNWYEFDDSQVTRVSRVEVTSQEAYVLFYERKDCCSSIDGEEEEQERSGDEDEGMETAEEDVAGQDGGGPPQEVRREMEMQEEEEENQDEKKEEEETKEEEEQKEWKEMDGQIKIMHTINE